jgi:dUTPase
LQVAIEPVTSLDDTARGAGGFGSTGLAAKE